MLGSGAANEVERPDVDVELDLERTEVLQVDEGAEPLGADEEDDTVLETAELFADEDNDPLRGPAVVAVLNEVRGL